jgi:hypothetical protein
MGQHITLYSAEYNRPNGPAHNTLNSAEWNCPIGLAHDTLQRGMKSPDWASTLFVSSNFFKENSIFSILRHRIDSFLEQFFYFWQKSSDSLESQNSRLDPPLLSGICVLVDRVANKGMLFYDTATVLHVLILKSYPRMVRIAFNQT